MREIPSPETSYYFERFGFCERQIQRTPHRDLGIVVVIPCFDEPNLIRTLESLWACARPRCAVEVIIVVNSGAGTGTEVLVRNETTLREARAWASTHLTESFQFELLHFPELPPKKAGVGLARKIGMDEALRRFHWVGRPEGVILCFDADCVSDPNYLVAVEEYFTHAPQSPGCSIYFEHPLHGPEDPRIYEAIVRYELHLRYYVEALRFAAFPHAFHTIGSSMAVRADAYRKQGGMNKRQAGEDFYFLHKIIPLGGFGEINGTRVIPSPRPSERVPFGTGRAVREFLESGEFKTYPWQAFRDLREFFLQVPALYRSKDASENLPDSLVQFLAKERFPKVLAELREHTASPESFQKRFFRWFDGFLAMKYIHFARDHFYGPGEIVPAARELLELSLAPASLPNSPLELLLLYRDLQRSSN